MSGETDFNSELLNRGSRKYKKSNRSPYLSKTVTIVKSVNGKPLSDVAPGMRNRFDSAVDAVRKVRAAIGDHNARIITRRIDIAKASIMRI